MTARIRAAAPLTQNSRLSAYSRQRRHLTASSRAIPTTAPPSCSSEPGTPAWPHAHCRHTTPTPDRGLCRSEPLLRNRFCSVRKTRIPPSRPGPVSCFSSSCLSVRSSGKRSQQVVCYFLSAPPRWCSMWC